MLLRGPCSSPIFFLKPNEIFLSHPSNSSCFSFLVATFEKFPENLQITRLFFRLWRSCSLVVKKMHHIFADASAKKSCDGNTSKPNSFEKAGFVTSLHDTHTRVLFKVTRFPDVVVESIL